MRRKPRKDNIIMVMRDDGLYDYVSEREFKKQKKAEKKEYKREYNQWRKHNYNETTLFAIFLMGIVSFFCGFGGMKFVVGALVATGISMYLYWIEER